jgi:radical SAM superfamily enzyme YgiQ (UPF0313 family)
MANKLALIYPTMHSDIYSSELLYNPLALAYVGAYTPADWSITLHDEYVDEFVDPDKIDADLVGMSALTPNIPRAYYLADKLRRRGIQTVCGGAHVSALPDEALRFFDAVVVGEAEPIWPEVITDFEAGNLKQLYDGGMDRSVEDIRLPRRDLIHKNYHYPSLITSKGCPFRCDYCYLSVYEKKNYRPLPVDAILEDMEQVDRQTDFAAIFVDENVSGYSAKDHENRVALFEGMIQKKFRFVWGAQSTIDVYKKPELLKLMRAAGCRALFVGLESIDSDLGNQVNKSFADRIDYKEAIRVIHRHRIGVIGSFMLGLDNQDLSYAKRLPEVVKKLNIEYPRLFFLTAWPGTPLYKRLEEQGRIAKGYSHVRKDIPNILYSHFSEDEIREARQWIKREFFTKPYIAKIILRWLVKDPAMLKFFIGVLKSNIGGDARRRKKEQWEKEAFMKDLIEEHFRGTEKEFDEAQMFGEEIGGSFS